MFVRLYQYKCCVPLDPQQKTYSLSYCKTTKHSLDGKEQGKWEIKFGKIETP